MKITKYISAVIAIISLSVSCSKEEGLSTQNKDKQKPTVTITQTELTDDKLTFKVQASSEASQYAYAVLDGSENAVPDPRDILFKEVSGAKKFEAFHVKDMPSVTVEMKCVSTQSYQVFAVAITPTGLISPVVELKVTAPDTIIPAPHRYTYSGNTITIEFFEAVKRGTGRVMVRHMQEIDRKTLDLVYLSEDDIEFSDGNAVITCPRPLNGTAHGSVFMLSYEEGAFIDYSGNKCEAYWSKYNETSDTYTGMCWQDDHVNFPVESSYFKTYADDYDWSIENPSVSLTFPFDVFDAAVTEPIQVIYNELEGIQTMYTDNYRLEDDKRTVTIFLPKNPEGYFDVSIKEGAFYDVWGNESHAFSPDTDNLRYSVVLPEPVYGTYMIEYETKPFQATFEKEGDDYVVIYANWFNIWENKYGNPILRGKLNKARRTITFDGTFYNEGNFTGGAFGRGLYFYDSNHNYTLAFWGSGRSGEDPIIMKYDESGYIYTTSAFEYAIHQTSTSIETGSYGKVNDGTSLTYISSEPVEKFE